MFFLSVLFCMIVVVIERLLAVDPIIKILWTLNNKKLNLQILTYFNNNPYICRNWGDELLEFWERNVVPCGFDFLILTLFKSSLGIKNHVHNAAHKFGDLVPKKEFGLPKNKDKLMDDIMMTTSTSFMQSAVEAEAV